MSHSTRPLIPPRHQDQVVRVRKQGNSHVIPIGKYVLRELGWNRGDFIACLVRDGCLVGAKVNVAGLLIPKEDACLDQTGKSGN